MTLEMDSEEIFSYLHEILEKASVMEPLPEYTEETTKSLYAMAYRFYENGKYLDAIHFFKLLTCLAAYDSKNWMGLGASYQLLKQHDQALQPYAIAAMLAKDDPAPHFHAAECFFTLRQNANGMKALDSAEQLAREQDSYLLPRILLLREIWIG